MVWQAAGRSVRGASHYTSNTPCQDASGFRVLCDGTVFVGCVADGGGTAKLSDIGSRVSCLTVLNILSVAVNQHRDALLNRASAEQMDGFWRAVVRDVRACLEAEGSVLGGMGIKPFGTTLLAAIATPDQIDFMQIGDGFIVYGPGQQPPDAEAPAAYRLAHVSEGGEYVGETVWVTSSNWESGFAAKRLEGPVNFVCLSTDGLEKVAIQRPQNEPYSGYFDFVRREIDRSRGQSLDPLLDKILLDPRLDRRTDDDKSVVVARWFEE